MEVWKFCLDDVRGPVCTTQKVTILPFITVSVHANTSVKGHCMQVHVLTEPMPGPQLPAAVVPTVTYGEFHHWSSRVPICLHNLSTNAIENSHKSCGWTVCPCQPSATISPPNQNICKSHITNHRGMGLGGLGPPRSQRVARIRTETGQRVTAPNGSTCLHAATWTWGKLL